MTDAQRLLLGALADGQYLRCWYATGSWKYVGGPTVDSRIAYELRDAGYIKLVDGSTTSGLYGITAEGRRVLHVTD